DREGLVHVQWAVPLDELVEIAPLHELQDEVMPALVQAPIVDRDDVGVFQGLRRAGLAQEALEECGVAREGPQQHLERDLMAGLRVDGPEDRAHAAASDRLDDPIAAYPLTDQLVTEGRG